MENGAFTPDESITPHQNGVSKVDGSDGKVENGNSVENGGAANLPNEDQERQLGVLCGAAGIYPKWLQNFARPRFFLLIYCIQQITLGACNAYIVGANTSIEKHFNYTSTDIGVLNLLSEIGPFLFTLILSYWGSMGNRPRWMGIGPIISGFGIFMIFLIYVFFPAPALSESGLVDDKSKKYCQPKEEISFSPLEPGTNNNSVLYTIPGEEEFDDICFEPNTGAGFLFVIAHTLIGMGTAVTYTVGASYMDDSISKNDAPIYFGVTLGVRILGPTIGFTMAGRVLRIYVNPSESYGITPKDPRWIGAWWIGPIIFSIIMVINSFLLLLFPEKMERGSGSRSNSNKPDKLSIMFSKISIPTSSTKGTENQSNENGINKNSVNGINGNCIKHETNHQNGHIIDKPKSNENKEKSFSVKKLKEDVKGLTQMLKKLIRNKPLMCMTISDFCAFLGLIGLIFWLSKYLEHQFRISKSTAAFYAGISSTSSIILGVIGGSVWIRRCHPSARTVAIVMATCSMAYAASLIGLSFVTCDFNDDLPGILSPDETSLELYRECSSSACECGKAEFIPVCVEDGPIKLTYFSPCHAGCPDTGQPSNSTEYFNCTCGSSNAKVTSGYCKSTCSGFIFYNVFTIVVKAFVAIGGIGGFLITMRCVTPEEKPVALGLKITLISFVLMVNPLIFARLTDSSCLVWSEACGKQGSCWIYDADDLGVKLHGCAGFLFFISGVFEILLAITVGDLQLMEEPKKSLSASPSTTTTGGRSYISSLRKFSQRTLTSTASVNTTASSANNSIRSVDNKEGLKIEETIPETDDAIPANKDENVLPSEIVKTTGV